MQCEGNIMSLLPLGYGWLHHIHPATELPCTARLPCSSPLPSVHTSTRSAVRDMLARGVADPYCRFIEPGQYDFMSDVSLTGLNLGTGNEYRWKTVSECLCGWGGVRGGCASWVLGEEQAERGNRRAVGRGGNE